MVNALFGLKYPIFQAPTGSIAGPELASAVCRAGGMGALALTWTEPVVAAEYVSQVREQILSEGSSGSFLVNFALAFPPESLSAALDAGAPFVSFSWGDPSPYIRLVKSTGAKIGIQVTNVDGARRAVEQGADFLICQGVEAGGHVQSNRSLWDILPEVVSVSRGVPIVAAGGIGDGKGIAKALRAGAQAAMLGTRFVATLESRAHPLYKQLLLNSSARDTALTICFEGGWSYAAHRVLRNSTLENWEGAGSPKVGKRPGEGEVVGFTADNQIIYRYEDTAPRDGFTGEIEEMCLYAGTSCGVITDIPSASELVRRLWEECQAALNVRLA